MKLTRKSLMLLFFLFNLAYIQCEDLPSEGLDLKVSGSQTKKIQLNEYYDYGQYIGIILSKAKPQNPYIYIAKDEACEDRFFAGVQMIDDIYSFVKTSDIKQNQNKFYICTVERQKSNSDSTQYEIKIKDIDQVRLPFDTQASYYVYGESIKTMNFVFYPENVIGNPEITFWVKGKNITFATMGPSSSLHIENGYYFYDLYADDMKSELTVDANVGDYITIGSTLVTDKKANELKVNANEKVVASKNEVCFPIQATKELSFITGKIYTKRAKTFLTDENNREIVEIEDKKYEMEITDGIINDINILQLKNITNGYYCVGKQEKDGKFMVFSVQMRNEQKDPAQVNIPPLLPGEIRRHTLLNGQMAIFYGSKPNDDALEVNFNIKAYKGFPQTYSLNCTTFPYCHYTQNSLNDINYIYPSNMVTTYSFYLNALKNRDFSPISSFQPLIIVYCAKGGKEDEFFGEDSFCEFETTYFTDKDSIKLYEGCSFSQFLSEFEEDKYTINLKNEDIDLIYLDLLLFSGDADIVLPNSFPGENANKYYLSNKIFYSIRINMDIEKPDSFEFYINAIEPTFYLVEYKLLNSKETTEDINTLDSGINYITSKAFYGAFNKIPKHLEFLNFKYEFNQPYLVSLYSPNCIFDVDIDKNGVRDTIAENTNEMQQIIISRNDYYGEKFNFYYTIKEDENTAFSNRICMVYAAGLELSNSTEEWNERSISLSEGVPHRYMFSRFHPFIAYSYHVSDTTKKLVIYFNLIDKDYFNITINVNGFYLKHEKIYRNSQIFVTPENFTDKCVPFEVCTVDVRIQMKGFARARTVETTMYQLDNIPFYLEKNVVKQDILIGNIPKHYYFDIGESDYGDITLDFKRGSGNIFAIVKERNLNETMKDPDWRKKYRFPEFIHDSLPYDTYGKKVLITEESTKICTGGCYVLITILSNIRYEGEDKNDNETSFRISINPRIVRKDTNYPIPKVRIGVNDFIIGNIMYGLPENRKYDYYSVILPFESEQILIDWQADSPSLIINVGDTRPTKYDADFIFPPIGKDIVHVINRSEILEKGGFKNNTFIRNLNLTIGVYADVSDSITSSPYAFKILMPPSMPHRPPPHRPSDRPSDDQSSDRPRPPMPIPLGPVMHMIHIRSDQKIQCLPFIYENTYTCLFAVIVDDSDVNNNIIIYARSQDGNPVTIYGTDVDAEDIERNNNTKIMKYIEEVFNKDYYKQPQSYFNIENAQKSKSFLFMTTLDYSGDIIEILSSSFRYRDGMSLYPNPSTAQVFSMSNKKVNFKFSTTKNLLINIACITGNGNFYWENNENKKFYLDGPNDRLSLTTYVETVDDALSSLKIETKQDFIFVVTYYPRTEVDQLNKNQNTEMHYRSVVMPLNYYVPITIGNDWTINFNFYEIGLKDNSNLVYDTSLFTIWATIISEKTAQSVRYYPQSRPTCDNHCVKGIYDSTFGHLYLDKDFIEDAMKQENIEAPYLFFSVDTDVRTDFSTMDMEISIFSDFELGVQKDIFVSGKLSNSKEKKYVYNLYTKGENTLYVQYAANSDSIKFVLNSNPDSEENDYDVKTNTKYGYNQMEIALNQKKSFIFLIIFYKDNLNEQLTHFIFRYSFESLIGSQFSNNGITLKGEDNNYEIIFSPISNNKVTSYYIKAYYKDGLIDGEKIETISMSESPGAYMQINNETSNNKQLSYNLTTEKRVKYIKVMAITTEIDSNKKHYYLYNIADAYRELKPKMMQPNGELPLSGEGNKTFFIQLNEEKNTYADYITIYLQEEQTKNPMIYVGKDEDCTNRLFVGTQMYDHIYGFIKKDQIDKEFYICIKERQNTNSQTHHIFITNTPSLTIPYNAIASHYISEESVETIKCKFGPDENIGSDITFWVTGKNIVNADLPNFEKKQIDNGYVFYGTYRQGAEITVETKVGDYITVGSTVVTKRKTTKYLTENTRERMIASKGEVCLPIKITEGLSFINGKIYTKKAKTYFKDNNDEIIQISGKTYESTINNGIISDMNILRISGHEDGGYYCINNEDNELMIFSVQLTKSEDDFGDIFLSPMLPGEIKRHYLLKGQMAIFYGMKPNKDAIEVNFNIKALAGFPEMYYDECKTFPYCHYTKGLLKKLTHPYPSNMVTTYSYYKGETDDYTPISTFQPLMIVNCDDANKDMLFDQGFYCEFETTYFTDQDTIKLYQDTAFSQFLYYDEEDKYEINLKNDDVDLIYLDLLLFSGDADIVLPDFKGTAHKYYLSNKIFYSIHLDNNKPNSLEFRINATEKTFYTVQYKLLKSSQSDDMNTLESGINYITSKYYDASVTQTEKNEKHLQFLNLKYEYYQPYLVTFYSPNCLFDVYWLKNKTTNEIEQINNDSYQAQRIINPLDEDYHYYSDKFEFYYKIKEDDSSQYPKKFCMIYATGIEITNFTQQWNGRSISLSEGVPHRYRFNEEHPYIVYSYHVSDPTKNLILNFNLLDKEYFDVNVDINKRKDVIFSTVYRNGQITITDEELKGYCVEFEVCTVDVKISMRSSKMGRMLEFTMYQLDKNPFYLEKNVVKQDILNGNMPKHYYFDISNQEYGDITLDFKRGSGKMYASIQSRTLDKPMADPEWRGKYHFPQTIDESLKYDVYGKKIIIAAENTTKCENGCYVLITIFSSVRYYGIMDDKVTPFRISINPRIMQIYDFVLSPRVKINVNDYIVGSIMYGATENRKYDYYSFVIPYESEQLMIDWQADSPSLLINVGDIRPKVENKNFTPSVLHQDYVYIINRTEIIKIAEKTIGWSDKDHMRNMELTIGVYSDDIDSITSSPYTFKIFMPGTMENRSSTPSGEQQPIPDPDSNLMAAAMHIIHIRSDQKVQCFPFSYKGTYSCIFAVIVDDMDIRSNIIVYPKAQDGSPVTIYGKIVNSEEVERNNGPRLMAHIRDIFKNDEYKRHDQFIYYKNVEKTEAFLFIVTQEGTQEIVEVLSSSFFIKYDNVSYTPNPSTPQIYAIGDHSINFNFWTTKDYLVNIACVSGRGKFYWQDHPDVKYYLGGFGDRISLTTYTNIEENKLSLLKVESDTNEETDFLQGGFIFYITYYPRSNVDQLKTGQSTEINYRNVNMPLNYFAPIKMADDWIINFNFYDISLKNKANLQYDTNLFNVWATIVSDEKAQEIRKDSNKKPNYDSNSIKGIYDSSLGCLFLDKETAATMFDDKQTTGVPTLFFSIEKNSGVGADFSTLGLEVNVYSRSPNEEIIEVPERIFISGKLSYSNKNRLVYHLKLDRNKLYITIQCSANSNLLKFELSTNPDRKEDVLDHPVPKDIIGIRLISVELDENNFPKNGVYLIVSTDEKNITKPLDYFTFGYFLSSYKENIGSILEGDDLKLKVDRNRQNYKISFKPIPFDGVSYYIKAYYKSGFIEGEKIETIAISESPGQYLVVNAPAHEILKEISCDLTTRKAVNYIKVIAKLNLQEYKLYNVYEPKFVNTEDVTGDEEDNKNKNEDSNKTLIYVCIGIGSVLLVIAIVLFVFFFLYKNRNRNLLEQVNKISFAESGAQDKEKEDSSNLLINEDEETLT